MNWRKAQKGLRIPDDADQRSGLMRFAGECRGFAESRYESFAEDRANEAMSQDELFQKAGLVTRSTGQRALADLLAAGKVERTGEG